MGFHSRFFLPSVLISILSFGCTETIDLKTFTTAPTEFSPDGDGVNDTTKLSIKSTASINDTHYKDSSTTLSQAVTIEVKDKGGASVVSLTDSVQVDRTGAKLNGSLWTLLIPDRELSWDGMKPDGTVAPDGEYSCSAIAKLVGTVNGAASQLAISDVVTANLTIKSGKIDLQILSPSEGQRILYSYYMDVVVRATSAEPFDVKLDGRSWSESRGDVLIFKSVTLKKGRNTFKISATSIAGRAEKYLNVDSVQRSTDGNIVKDEGGIVEVNDGTSPANGIKLVVYPRSLPRDTKVEIKADTASAASSKGAIIPVGQPVVIEPQDITLSEPAEVVFPYSSRLVEIGRTVKGVVNVFKEEASGLTNMDLSHVMPGEDRIGGRISSFGKFIPAAEYQTNFVMSTLAGAGGTVPGPEGTTFDQSRFGTTITSVKGDANGRVYIISGSAIYQLDLQRNVVKEFIDFGADPRWSGGIPTSLAVKPDGSEIFVAFTFGGIMKYPVESGGGVGAGTQMTGTAAQLPPAAGLPITRVVFSRPLGLGILPDDNLIVVDAWQRKIFRVSNEGTLSEIAGTGWRTGVDTDDPHLAVESELDIPQAGEVSVINDRYVLFFADTYGHRVRVMNVNSRPVKMYGKTLEPGYIMTVAGHQCTLPFVLKWMCGSYAGDGGLARDANLKSPKGVSYDKLTQTLYISDTGNGVVRAVTSDGRITTIAGGSSGVQGVLAREEPLPGVGQIVASVFTPAGYPFERIPEKYLIGTIGGVLKLMAEEIKSVEILDDGGNAVIEQVVGEYVSIRVTFGALHGDQIGSTHSNWGQVICNGNQTTGFSKGAFLREYGCAKDGTDYISSKDQQGNLPVYWDERKLEKVLTLGPYTRNSPGSSRWAFEVLPGGIFKHYVDVPFKLHAGTLENKTLHVSMANETIRPGDHAETPPTECAISNQYKCDYHYLGDTFSPVYATPQNLSGEVVLDDCSQHILKGTQTTANVCADVRYFNVLGTQPGRKALFNKLLKRAEDMGTDSIMIQFAYNVQKAVIPDPSDPKAITAARYVVAMKPGISQPMEILDDLAGILKQRYDVTGKIKKLILELGLDAVVSTGCQPQGDPRDIYCKDGSSMIAAPCDTGGEDIGPITKDEMRKLSGWDTTHAIRYCPRSSPPDFHDVLLADGVTKGALEGATGDLENLRQDFFVGDIWTTTPKFEVKAVYSENPATFVTNATYLLGKLEWFPVEIDGAECQGQESVGIFNYGCYLKQVATWAQRYHDVHGLDVIVSVMNDHAAILEMLPYPMKKDAAQPSRDLLAEARGACPACKFTTGIAHNGVGEDIYFRDPVVGLKKLYNRMEAGGNYFMEYVGFNGWVDGACRDQTASGFDAVNALNNYYNAKAAIIPVGSPNGKEIENASMFQDCAGYPTIGASHQPVDVNSQVDPGYSYMAKNKEGVYITKLAYPWTDDPNYLSKNLLGQVNQKLMIMESGYASVEYESYNPGYQPQFKTINGLQRGLSNVQDNQEQVDNLETEVSAFFESVQGRTEFVGRQNGLKGFVYFAEESVWDENTFATQFYVSPRNKALTSYLSNLFR